MTTTHRAAGGGRIGTSRAKRAAALVPLAMLSAAWTISIGTSGASTATADDQQKLPDGTKVPAQALQVPASVTSDTADAGATGETAQQIVATSSASAIPAAALAAYQRAETVINKADPTCRMPWQLLAAIGRVESNHGRAQGNTLSDTGLSTPGIYGRQLDGTHGTSRVADTDGGVYDGDTTFDKAVGPMQFIPSTWSSVGVDADGDGKRDPQNINDAALAAAVYLCSGEENLATDAGQRAAVLRYNHSSSYVATVMAVYQDYLVGDFTAVPNSVVPASYFEPEASIRTPQSSAKQTKTTTLAAAKPSALASVPAGTASTPSTQPSTAPKPSPSASPSTGTLQLPKPSPIVIPTTGVEPVDKVLTKAEATAQCLADFGYNSINGLLAALANPANLGKAIPSLADLTACVTKLLS
ncbi:lytic transglycosylase domain-containing protein [Nocardioides sp.]|uniref:lytic transglycosylase domain-containing protein n=1 Tax=Nocardioides sp. TaxID=35761 RepID=UPI002601BC69|nr:lytic transglycosylase domain-containing protein [Nocardioides sp.]